MKVTYRFFSADVCANLHCMLVVGNGKGHFDRYFFLYVLVECSHKLHEFMVVQLLFRVVQTCDQNIQFLHVFLLILDYLVGEKLPLLLQKDYRRVILHELVDVVDVVEGGHILFGKEF